MAITMAATVSGVAMAANTDPKYLHARAEHIERIRAALEQQSAANGWIVAVGYFESPDEAFGHIYAVRKRTGEMFNGHDSAVNEIKHESLPQYPWQAQFRGYNEREAVTTCNLAKAMGVSCTPVKLSRQEYLAGGN
jgi:hypothetical protein